MKEIIRKTYHFTRYHTIPHIWNTFRSVTAKKTCILKYNPISLGIYVTDRCTLQCNMCHAHSPNRPLNNPYRHEPCEDMSFSKFKQIANKFRCAISLSLVGTGEPFLNEDIFDMIKYGANLHMQVGVITNGTILDDKIDKIINSPLRSISISLNGYNAEEFCRMTENPEQFYYDIVRNISNLVEKRKKKNKQHPEIGMSYIAYKENYKYIPNIVNLADELGVDSLQFHNLLPIDIPGFTKDQCLYEGDQEVIEVISSVDKPKSKLRVIMPVLLQSTITERRCSGYFHSIRVDSRGSVTACHAVIQASEKYGNVFSDKDVWNNEYFRNMRGMFLDKSIPLLECCKTCSSNSTFKPTILQGKT